uniref:Uncharacterized protein n=1 Tax=Acrobeloides nanus TaxID=290746 RepID=A0A914E9G4_9BILA
MQSKDDFRLSLTYSHGVHFIGSIQNNSKVMILEIDSGHTDPNFLIEDSFYDALNSADNLFFIDVNMDNKKDSTVLLDLYDDVLQVNNEEFNKLLSDEFGVPLLIKGIKSHIAGEFLNEPSLSLDTKPSGYTDTAKKYLH